MSLQSESAELILKLYDLRREAKMREARDWLVGAFFPDTVDDVLAAWRGETSARYRMVTTYWDMACGLVNDGAIDAAMFHHANNEHILVYVKLEPHLAELRKTTGLPQYMVQLEKLIKFDPTLKERVEGMRGRIAKMKETRAAAAK